MAIIIRQSLGNYALYKKLKSIGADTQGAIRRAWYWIGKDLVRKAGQYIQEPPKSGRIYTLYKNGRKIQHQASASGESPAEITGELRRKLNYSVLSWQRMEFGNSAPYARFLENTDGQPDLHRPSMIRAITDLQPQIISRFNDQLRSALGNA